MRTILFFITIACLSMSSVQAQTKFSVNGLGRTIISNDKLSGNVLNNDAATPNKGVGGYILFDLGNNLDISKEFKANAILRVRAPFGAFWGVGTRFELRQFQVAGKIKKNIEFQIGDINIKSISPYMVNNFSTEYHKYEADAFAIRRDILEYENFIFGNDWRLQGAHAYGQWSFNKVAEALNIYSFVVRTNSTNDIDLPDRILAGTRIGLVKNKNFEIAGNYVGLTDIAISDATVNYKNQVLTGNAVYSIDRDLFGIKIKGEGGYSDFNYSKDSADVSASYSDYIYDAAVELTFKPAKTKLIVSYRDVGPNFTSPSAQTRRIDVGRFEMGTIRSGHAPQLFPTIFNNTASRNISLFDRFTDESLYRRSLSPVLMNYLPEYNNITPYGTATPNRRGLALGLATDTSLKMLQSEVHVEMLKEIIGEGIKDKRSYLGIRGGTVLHVNELMHINRLMNVNAGVRYENTSRNGLAPIQLNSTLLDLGFAVEVFKQFDLLVGAKLLNARGNEYVNQRDEFNQIGSITDSDIEIQESIYSAGFRLRIREGSVFNVCYNINNYWDKTRTNLDYKVDQVFVNFTLKF